MDGLILLEFKWICTVADIEMTQISIIISIIRIKRSCSKSLNHLPLVTQGAAPRPPDTPAPCSPPTACTRSHHYSAYGCASQSSSYSGRYNAVCDFVFSGQKAWRSLSSDGRHKRLNVSGQWQDSISSASPDDDQHPRCWGNETAPSPRPDTGQTTEENLWKEKSTPLNEKEIKLSNSEMTHQKQKFNVLCQ